MTVYWRYIIRGLCILLCVTICVIGVYALVQFALQPSSVQTETSGVSAEAVVTSDKNQAANTEVASEPMPLSDTTSSSDVASEGVASDDGLYIADIPMSDEQRNMLNSFGLDDETYISPAMITCAEETLGPERKAAIFAGDTPNFLETTQLLGCLR